MKVCKSSDEAKVQRKIFLVKLNNELQKEKDIWNVRTKEIERIELTPELEEKMFKELREKFYDIDYFTFKQTIQKLKEELK